jgi:hypothetical protein
MSQTLLDHEKTKNVKVCPKCSVMVDKTGGCNLIRCQCGARWCWVCNRIKGGNRMRKGDHKRLFCREKMHQSH